MDYDDNDIRCHNFQIAGEDIYSFPPSLQSLPKFVLDEHLQVHPRFDSLVEGEVLFGIQDQGPNWIEEFTPVGSEIEFSSTVAESCSISRPKNVWSEATSSESVEMLLKSVGGDEMMDQKVLIEDADTIVGLDTCLLDEGCSVSEFPDNAITYQVNALEKESQAVKIALLEKESYSLVMEGDGDIEKTRFTTQEYRSKGHSEIPVHLSKDDGTHDGTEHKSLGGVIEEKQNPDVQLSDNNNGSDGNTSKFTVEAPSLNDMRCEMTSEAIRDDDVVGFSPLTSQSTSNNYGDGDISEKLVQDESEIDAVAKVNSNLHSLCNSTDVYDSQAEGSLPVDVILEQKVVTTLSPPLLLIQLDEKEVEIPGSTVLESNIVAPLSRESDVPIVVDSYSTKDMTHHEPEVDDLDAIDANLHPLSNSTDVYRSQPEDSLPMDVVVEQKEVTTTQLPESVLVQLDVKEAEVLRSTILQSNIPRESDDTVLVDSSSAEDMTYHEPEVDALEAVDANLDPPSNSTDIYQLQPEDSLPMDVVVEQKEVTTTHLPESVLVQHDEKEVEIPGSTILESNIDAPVLRESDDTFVVDISSAEDSTHREPEVDALAAVDANLLPPSKSTYVYESQPEDSLPIVVEQKEVTITQLPDPVCSQLDEKEVEGTGSTILESSNIDAPASKESDDTFVVDCSSAEDMIHCEQDIALSTYDVNVHFVNNTADIQEPQAEGTVSMDVVVEQKEATTTQLPASVVKPGEKEVEIPGSTNLNRIIDARIPRGSDDTVVVDNSSAKDMTHDDPVVEQKEATIVQFPESVLIQPDENEVEGPGSTIVKSKIDTQIPRESDDLVDPESSTDKYMTQDVPEPQLIVVGLSSSPEPSDAGCHNEFQSSTSIHEHTMQPEENLVSHGFLKINVDSDPSGTFSQEDNTSQVSGFSTTNRVAVLQVEVVKETPVPKKSAGSDGKPCRTPKSVGAGNRNVQSKEMQHCSYTGSNIGESCSSMLDLNTSISASSMLHQPFTDAQQVQLRAQIFVYGSLIQETPPEEACMISAFGEPGGGRSLWYDVWRVFAERNQIRKTPLSSYETPSHSHSVSQQVTRCTSLQIKAPSMPISLPLPSPTIPRVAHLDFNQALSPLHSHQPWSSQNSTLDASTQYSTIPVVKTAKAIPAKDSSVPLSLTVPIVSPTSFSSIPEARRVSATSVAQIGSQGKTKAPGNNKGTLTAQKTRKRKKITDVTRNSLPSTSTSHIISPTHYQIVSEGGTEQRAIFSEETCSKIEQAKLQAEDAASFAASALRHSQGVWIQLATQKDSRLVSDACEKLVSAAVAVAAAANVAKAAAAAAKVASDAALQAKLLADEVLNSRRTGILARVSEKLTPASVPEGSPVISAARDAARRRVEATSAATKRAENLDAIVRAAELAAEAVSQAGTVIAMGEPLPFTLSELIEAGPEGHWRVHQSTTCKLSKASSSLQQEENICLDGTNNRDISVEGLSEHLSNNKGVQKTTIEDGIVSCNEPVQPKEHHKGNGSGNASSIPSDGHEEDHSASNNEENAIRKGCLVEVMVEEEGLRGVWFSAHVLDVNDGKAYVCYNNLVSDEGTGLLKEWKSLEGEDGKAPRIRVAHPMTAAKYEGTRKRNREAIKNYVWAVGDHVDARINDGWWEGIITEKSQVDDTKLTIHFPDGGDSSAIRAWDLRPSLVLKDGRWLEWSRASENSLQAEGDTPREKRQKSGRPEAIIQSEVDGNGISRPSKNLPVENSRKNEESRQLNLSTREKLISVEKNAREENRTGLQKEGSRVGVPKPGKKRKFMEVSKHYVGGKTNKTSEGNDSIKFAKYLMPQASHIWRNTPKVDTKGKGVRNPNSKGIKSVKSQSIQPRNSTERNKSVPSTNGGFSGHVSVSNARVAVSDEQINLEKKIPHVEPSVPPVPVFLSSKKKSSSAVEENSGVGKSALAVDKSSKSEEDSENTGKTMNDATEPRRSSRRIQPTSRLLEGLQSSLITSKIPTFPHDKGTKAQHRGASSSRGNVHG